LIADGCVPTDCFRLGSKFAQLLLEFKKLLSQGGVVTFDCFGIAARGCALRHAVCSLAFGVVLPAWHATSLRVIAADLARLCTKAYQHLFEFESL